MRSTPFVVVAGLAIAALATSSASAFHSGGVAACSGCHTMHVSQDGGPGPDWTPGGNPNLLKYGTATDTCLRCHAARGQMSGGNGHGPGGDFYWLTRTFSWTTAWGSTGVSPGHTHGHNVASSANNVEADPLLTSAPGGTFRSDRLGCTSCHDPHGNDSFRMLYGTALGPVYDGGARFAFSAAAPLARGNGGSTLVGNTGSETDARHTIYKNGMSAWCANCHPGMHATDDSRFTHPAGALLTATIAGNYNRYFSTADPDGNVPATAYAGLVPFEDVAIDLETADPSHHTAGPDGSDQVMCLSCHRAHASPFGDAGRWDFTATYLDTGSHPATGDAGASALDVTNRYYGYAIAAGQRSLCNKCHAKDADGLLPPPPPDPHVGRRGPETDNPTGP